jgi:prepilin-type N-terminal cleavage/methylation domain-containing protein
MKRAFTLIELIIVVFIIAILAIIGINAVRGSGCSAQKIFGFNQPTIELHVPVASTTPTLLS